MLGWLLWLAVLAVISVVSAALAWVQTHWLLCLLLALAVLVGLGGSAANDGCAGLHCRGCRR